MLEEFGISGGEIIGMGRLILALAAVGFSWCYLGVVFGL